MPGDAPSAMPRAWTRRFVTQQGPQFARTGGLFLFARGDACLLPFTIFSGAIGEFLLVSIDGAAPRKPARRVRVALAPSRRGFGREAANRCRYTLAHLRSTESRTELAFAWGSVDWWLWSVHDFKE